LDLEVHQRAEGNDSIAEPYERWHLKRAEGDRADIDGHRENAWEDQRQSDPKLGPPKTDPVH
jgi:hypothetical protein